MEKTKRFTMTTREGSLRLLAVFTALIVLFSLAAQLISTSAYKTVVSDIVIDVRGADLHFELYRPATARDGDNLPCMIITHGGSESLAADSMMAWELARRGFVVMNVSAYGAGLSDQPYILEDGTSEERYNRGATMGMYDAYQYALSLTYVDHTRIGSWAHSTGRHLFTKMVSYFGQNLTLNDRLLNVLYNDFGIAITEDQLTADADAIAKAALNDVQLAVYEVKKAEQQKIVSEYMSCARLTERAYGVKAKVAGFDVIRDPQMNLLVGLGTHEGTGNYLLGESAQYRKIFHTGETAVERNCWYDIADYTKNADAVSTLIGEQFATRSDNSEALKAAIENGSARFFLSPVTMHNGNLWSPSALSTNLEFYTQALNYNNGELSDPATHPIDPRDLSAGYATLVCSTLAFFSLLGLIAALAAWLFKSPVFASCARDLSPARLVVKSRDFVVWVIATALTGFAGAYGASRSSLSFTVSNQTMSKWLPWEPGQVRTFFMLIATAVVGLVLFFALNLLTKKSKSNSLSSLSEIGLKLGVKNVFKTVGMAVMIFACCYAFASAINTFFDTRFMFVDGSFELMKSYSFGRMFRYALIVLPFTLIISCLNNLVTVKGVKSGTDTFINVLVTSLGMLILIGAAFIYTYSKIGNGDVFDLQCVLSIITLVPVCNYLYRKLYKVSGSVWLGALVVALLIGWRLAGYISHQFMFYGPNEVSAFWGIY